MLSFFVKKNPEKFYRKDTDDAVILDTKSICVSVLTHWTSDFRFVLSTELWSWLLEDITEMFLEVLRGNNNNNNNDKLIALNLKILPHLETSSGDFSIFTVYRYLHDYH